MNVSEMYRQFLTELPVKTGRTMEEWREEIRKHGPAKYQDRIEWLKCKHGFGYRPACLLAQHASDAPADYADPEGLIDKMYAGPKAALRPIFERLMEIGMGLGADVTESTGKTMVSLKRKHVFLQIKPATKTRVDLGLAFPAQHAPKHARLLSTGGLEKGDRITHRVELARLEDIDSGVVEWMKAAYRSTSCN